jgi:hypothetical protein
LIVEVGKSNSLKISPEEKNLVKKYCKVGKITIQKQVPRKQSLLKNTARLGKSP